MTWHYVRGVDALAGLRTYGDERGSIVQDPVQAAMRDMRAREKEWEDHYPGDILRRAGRTWAVWKLADKPTLQEAKTHAMAHRPDVLLVMLTELPRNLTVLALADETPFTFQDYSMSPLKEIQ